MKSFVGASPCHCTCPFSFSDAYGQLKNACTSPKLNVDTTKNDGLENVSRFKHGVILGYLHVI